MVRVHGGSPSFLLKIQSFAPAVVHASSPREADVHHTLSVATGMGPSWALAGIPNARTSVPRCLVLAVILPAIAPTPLPSFLGRGPCLTRLVPPPPTSR